MIRKPPACCCNIHTASRPPRASFSFSLLSAEYIVSLPRMLLLYMHTHSRSPAASLLFFLSLTLSLSLSRDMPSLPKRRCYTRAHTQPAARRESPFLSREVYTVVSTSAAAIHTHAAGRSHREFLSLSFTREKNIHATMHCCHQSLADSPTAQSPFCFSEEVISTR